MKKYAMVFDAGTGAGRCNLFDMSGRLVSYAYREWEYLKDLSSSNKEAMLFDAEQFKKILFSLCRKVITQAGISADEIVAVSATSQREGMVWLDRFGKEIYAAPSVDLRGEEAADLLSGKEPFIKEITGLPVSGMFGLARLLWYKKFNEAVYDRIDTVMMISDWICYLLCGSKVSEPSVASSSQLFDVKNGKWSSELLKSVGLRTDMFPEISDFGEQIGTVTKEAACETGLKEGTPVVGGAGDNAAAAVGTGVVEDGKAFTTIGSSGVVFAHTSDISIDPKGRVHTFCCAVPGCWHVMGVTQSAGLSLKWFRDNFAWSEMETAASMGVDPYYLMDKEADSVPIGANRLLYMPYLNGERTPHLDPNVRGAFVGLSTMHKKKDMLRAVMEGVSYSLRDCVEVMREMNISIDDMMACGGGGTSPLWRQMLADLYACNVKTTANKEGPALGVALLAAVGAGIYSSVPEACKAVIKPEKIQEPIAENSAKYEKVYALYKKLYPAMKANFDELASLDV